MNRHSRQLLNLSTVMGITEASAVFVLDEALADS